MKAAALRSSDLRVASGHRSTSRSMRCAVVCALPNAQQIKQTAVAAAAAVALAIAPSPAQAMCPDLISAPDGLKYCDVKIGSGEPPVKGAFIKAHYNGRLDSNSASGTFDSSYERGRPLGFAIGVGQVRPAASPQNFAFYN